MSAAGQCPHPEKRRWPVRDDPGGLACPCGHAWEPYRYEAVANTGFRHRGDPGVEVYQCRAAGTREPLDHFHVADRGKQAARAKDPLDPPVKDAVMSTADIQKPRWGGRRKAKPTTRAERRRLRRWRRM
jgi:hypothetical protein